MSIDERIEKFKDEFLQCKTTEEFLKWAEKWDKVIPENKMPEELGKDFDEHMQYLINLVGTDRSMIIN